jgi:hypothetical protein
LFINPENAFISCCKWHLAMRLALQKELIDVIIYLHSSTTWT